MFPRRTPACVRLATSSLLTVPLNIPFDRARREDEFLRDSRLENPAASAEHFQLAALSSSAAGDGTLSAVRPRVVVLSVSAVHARVSPSSAYARCCVGVIGLPLPMPRKGRLPS